MLKTITADAFFGKNRPSSIPSYAKSPQIDSLIKRISNINSSEYPIMTLKDILLIENKKIGAGQAAIDFIQSIDNNTVFVICGQQAGLFGGPLYTLYKAMHAVRLSSVLSAMTSKKVIPLFWVASDDHDFQEINHLGLQKDDGSIFSVDYTPAGYLNGAPSGEILLDSGIYNAIDALEKYCFPKKQIRKIY